MYKYINAINVTMVIQYHDHLFSLVIVDNVECTATCIL